MPLASGTRLGPYEIVAAVGAGGMGEVYRARDTRLNREVAIKVSAEQFNERFSREAYAVASLNHPNICTLHDVGPDYLVMEYVEGKPIQGPLPIPEALRVADQILAALDHAHRHGVLHRDLKPANILTTRQGIKLLDFGLAKVEKVVGGSDVTVAQAVTTQGTLFGTVHYMAPEQLEGKEADGRADIFSFGCVLYELVTGRRAFEGASPAAVIAAILHSRPAPLEPPALNRVVETCLASNPDDRWQTANELRHVLRWIGEESAPVSPPPLPARAWIAWVLALCMTIAAGVFGTLWMRRIGPAMPVSAFAVEAPSGAFFNFLITATAVSPNGRYLVFRAGSENLIPALWLRPLDSVAARRLPGTEGGDFPFWSPDSESIAFFAGDRLKKLDIAGGAPVVLAENVGSRTIWAAGGTWNRDGVMLFGEARGLIRIAASGGTPAVLIETDRSRRDRGYAYPQFLAGGKLFLYLLASDDPERQGIYAASLDHPERPVQIVRTRVKAAYSRPPGEGTGQLLFVRDRALLAQPFDADALGLVGDPVTIAEDVSTHSGLYGAAFWPSDAGFLVYRTGVVLERARLSWVDRHGTRLSDAGPEHAYSGVRLSPDGQRAAVSRRDPDDAGDIWVLELGSGRTTRLTFDPQADVCPVWSPNGREIAFSSDRNGIRQIYRKDVSGAGQESQLTDDAGAKCVLDWSPDGRHLLYTDVGASADLWVLPLDGTGRKAVPVVQTPFEETDGQFSPDGKWIAYTSNEAGRNEVFVTATEASPGSSRARWPVSVLGGRAPRWRGDSKELFYVAADNRSVMAVEIRTAATGIETGSPARLFAFPMVGVSADPAYTYDVTSDGKRFLIVEPIAFQSSPLTVLVNWQAKLKRP
jgi:Tol biopolymer transport system component/tRNA A-37 threonylcarbamoyl transferase component Bud32